MKKQKDIRPALRRHYNKSGMNYREYAAYLEKAIGLPVAQSSVEKWLAPNGKRKPQPAVAALIRINVDGVK